jgi:hypothetical protein
VNIDLYGSADIAWAGVLELLEAGRAQRFWLATVDADGRPHLAGIGARWVEGTIYFKSGAGTRKSRNLERDGRCVISAELPDFDLTFTGEAVRVTDEATVRRIAEIYAASGWPARATNSQLGPTTAHRPQGRHRGTSGRWRRNPALVSARAAPCVGTSRKEDACSRVHALTGRDGRDVAVGWCDE